MVHSTIFSVYYYLAKIATGFSAVSTIAGMFYLSACAKLFG